MTYGFADQHQSKPTSLFLETFQFSQKPTFRSDALLALESSYDITQLTGGILMKALAITLICAYSVSAFAWDMSQGLSKCGDDIYSPQILAAFKTVVDDELNRHDTPYTPGITVHSFSHPKFCDYKKSGNSVEVTIGSLVDADLWGDGVDSFEQGECFLVLTKEPDTKWTPVYLQCESFMVEDEL